MLISAVCPRCETQYQIDAGLRGKRMRCPNAICRHIFEVPPAASPPAELAPAPPVPKAPSASTRPVAAPKKPTAENTRDWSALAPPPVRTNVPSAAATHALDAPDIPGDFPEDEDEAEAPPFRHESVAAKMPVESAPVHSRRRSLRIIAVMLLILLGAAGAGWWRWQTGRAEREQTVADAADKAYQEQDYLTAAQRYQNLVRDFPDSEHAKKYAFLAELSDVRAGVYQPHENLDTLIASLGHVLEFLKVNAGDPLLQAKGPDAWQSLHDLTEVLLGHAESKEHDEPLMLAQRAWRETRKYAPPAGKNAAEVDSAFTTRFETLAKSLEAKEQRRRLLSQLDAWREQPTIDRVLNAKQIAAEAADAELQVKVHEMMKAHQAHITFVANPSPPASPKAHADPYPSVAFVSAIGKTRPLAVAKQPVLALARGVLYAFDPTNGEVRWVRRLGIDTTQLPIRIPADERAPARLLLLSSDQRTLTAVEEASGQPLWTHALSGDCLGTPVVVDQHALLATTAGRIEEIDLRGGHMHGWYQLDQPLPLGGIRMPDTPRVYFPGDRECLYEIDVAARRCTAIHYTGHKPGSLAGLPTPLPDPDDAQRSYLLWCETTGAETARIQPFELPGWRAAEPEWTARGWASLGAYTDAERFVLATDSGMLSIWGRRQKGNSDPLLFPQILHQRLASTTPGGLSKSLVAHVEVDRIWVISQGKLHSLHLDRTAQPSARLVSRWGNPPHVASPLHEVQVRRSGEGKTILYLTTQDTESPRCWLSAVDSESGEFCWQRQLGLIADQEAVVLPKYALLPSSGATYAVPRAELTGAAAWRFPRVEPMLDVEPQRAEAWHALKDKMLHLTWPITKRAARELHWRELGEPIQTAYLPDVPQGPPAVGATCIVVPLRNGELSRIPLAGGKVVSGPDWRAAGAEDHPALAAHVGSDRFAVADGRGGLALFDASSDKAWDRLGSATLPFRIIAAPLGMDGGKLRMVVFDASGTATLLEGERLLKIRSWNLGGKLSTRPFHVGRNVGCIVDGKRLMVLDPENDEPRWENTFVADVIGTPRRNGKTLAIADSAGGIHFFDAATGESPRPTITFKANVAPTIAPLPLGIDEWLAPLTDGTAILLPPEK